MVQWTHGLGPTTPHLHHTQTVKQDAVSSVRFGKHLYNEPFPKKLFFFFVESLVELCWTTHHPTEQTYIHKTQWKWWYSKWASKLVEIFNYKIVFSLICTTGHRNVRSAHTKCSHMFLSCPNSQKSKRCGDKYVWFHKTFWDTKSPVMFSSCLWSTERKCVW